MEQRHLLAPAEVYFPGAGWRGHDPPNMLDNFGNQIYKHPDYTIMSTCIYPGHGRYYPGQAMNLARARWLAPERKIME